MMSDTPFGGFDTPAQTPFIVGVGASAGGLEALEALFEHAPADQGVSYVVIQHLSPDFESLMDQLLARRTKMPIHLIRNEVPMEPNSVYLLPPNNEVIVSSGRLLLAERSSKKELHFPIDNFLRSLGQDAGPRAIGIILSGTGSDGSRGIQEIHRGGGFVIVQSEESAKFDGMPRSACDTGVADLVLAPEEMGDAIFRYVNSPLAAVGTSNPDVEHGRDGPIYSILSQLKKRFEIDFNCYKIGTIARRIERRLMLNGDSDLGTYAARLRVDQGELDRLYRDLLIGVTGFFRDPDVFAALQDDVLDKLVAKVDVMQDFRAWVVGTATGEEAYSMAIIIHEALQRAGRKGGVKVFASDVHRESLEFAGRGIYSEQNLAGLPEEYREKYFNEKADGFHAIAELRRSVVFVPHNAIANAPFTNLDLVSCRNVFIYFSPVTQKKVLSLFHFGLKPGGVLCLGSSESTGELRHEFESISDKLRLYRKHRDVTLPVSMRMPVGVLPAPTHAADQLNIGPSSPRPSELLESYDKLLAMFIPAGLLLGPNQELLHSFGDAKRLLTYPAGRPPENVYDLISPQLRTVISALVRRTREQPSAAAEVPESDSDGQVMRVTVERLADADERRFVRIDAAATHHESPSPVHVDVTSLNSSDYEELERELTMTRATLQSAVEEAQTTNEELQATNEQLTASNEELQSTNEELHSVNEELYTVNAEHQRKIDELVELTDDMDNLLNSTNVNTIFVDRQLRIRRFTPGIAKLFNLIQQDVGRRIDAFTHSIRYDSLVTSVSRVLRNGEQLEAEVTDNDSNWYLLRIQPYISQSRVEGAVITLIDVSTLKRTEQRLAELSEIVAHSDDAIFRCSADGIITTWNQSAERIFGLEEQQVLDTPASGLPWTFAGGTFEQLMQGLLAGKSLDSLDAEFASPEGGNGMLSVSISPIYDMENTAVGVSVVARDVTKQKQAEQHVREAIRRRDEFLAMLSHELRNPLAAVLNATMLIKEPDAEEKERIDAFDVIDHNVRHVARILDDVLDVARITNDKVKLHKEAVDLTALSMDVIDCVQHQVETRNQELHVDIPYSPLYVEGDVGRLQQVQVNLLVNASKYTGEGGRINYYLEQDGDDALITVSDDGDGISPELLDNIFEPFAQGEQSIERAQGGMGLGLALVKKVVDAHNGEVEASSGGVGKGSLFRVRLPLTMLRPSSDAPSEGEPCEGKRLLLVEDNDGIRRMLARTLQLKGFEVETAGNGVEALAQLEDFPAEIAVIDIGLPDLNGYELAGRIRQTEQHKNMLLVALTGYGQYRDRAKAKAAGFDIHLVKPVDPVELMRAIQSYRLDTESANPTSPTAS